MENSIPINTAQGMVPREHGSQHQQQQQQYQQERQQQQEQHQHQQQHVQESLSSLPFSPASTKESSTMSDIPTYPLPRVYSANEKARITTPTASSFNALPLDHHHGQTYTSFSPVTMAQFDQNSSTPSHDVRSPASTATVVLNSRATNDYHKSNKPGEKLKGSRRNQSWIRTFLQSYNSPKQFTFLSVIGLQAITILTMLALIYATIHNAIGDNVSLSDTFASDPELQTVATYLGVFILAVLFEIFCALDALQQKNTIQLFHLIAFQIAMLVYSSFLPSQLRAAVLGSTAQTPTVLRNVRIYALVVIAIQASVTIIMSLLTWKLWGEFGWDVFKRIGADLRLKRMYLLYQIYVCLLKFDGFMFVGFSIQFLVLVAGVPTVEFVITIAALPIIIIGLILAAIVVRYEKKWGTGICMFIQVLGMAYFIYKLVRIFDPVSGDRYLTARKTLAIFSVLSFLMLVATFIVTSLCFFNYGKGLKEKIPPYTFLRPNKRESLYYDPDKNRSSIEEEHSEDSRIYTNKSKGDHAYEMSEQQGGRDGGGGVGGREGGETKSGIQTTASTTTIPTYHQYAENVRGGSPHTNPFPSPQQPSQQRLKPTRSRMSMD